MLPESCELTIVGRSTSHFTRVTRIFAAETQVRYRFEVVPDLRRDDQADYAGNPALKIPILRTPDGTWFGALNICRELWRRAPEKPHVVWPEHLEGHRLANAQELVSQGMATEVVLLMSRLLGSSDGAHAAKLLQSLTNTVGWLEQHVAELLTLLPRQRDLSFLELTLHCFVQHLSFREVLSIDPYPRLSEFVRGYEARASVRDTAYRVD